MRAFVVALCLFAALPARAAPSTEAKANLKSGYVAQRAFLQEKDVYSAEVFELGFQPERGNRYSYYFAATGDSQRRDQVLLDFSPGRSVSIIEVDRHRYRDAVFPPSVAATKCPVTLAGGPSYVQGVGVFGGEASYEMEFVILAAGNLDADDTLDCWTIASFPRTAPDGKAVPAGEPLHEQSDLTPEEEETAEAAEAQLRLEREREDLRRAAGAMRLNDPKSKDTFVLLATWQAAVRGVPAERRREPAAWATAAGTATTDAWGSKVTVLRVLTGLRRAMLVALSPGPDKVAGTPDDLAVQLTREERDDRDE